jgi:hypothetical protein
MGWVCLSDSCKVSDGVWNSKGLAYFSISDDVLAIHDGSIHFLATIAPWVYGLFLGLLFFFVVIMVFYAVQQRIKRLSV